MQLIMVFVEWLWQAVAQVWEAWCEHVLMQLMGLGFSIIASDTAFLEVASGMVVDGSICSATLVAVLWKDTNYCSKYPDFPQGVKYGNWLTSIEWCKLLEALVSIGLGMLGSVLKVLLNL